MNKKQLIELIIISVTIGILLSIILIGNTELAKLNVKLNSTNTELEQTKSELKQTKSELTQAKEDIRERDKILISLGYAYKANELDNCHICGSEVQVNLNINNDKFYISCENENCNFYYGFFETKDELFDSWNNVIESED